MAHVGNRLPGRCRKGRKISLYTSMRQLHRCSVTLKKWGGKYILFFEKEDI